MLVRDGQFGEASSHLRCSQQALAIERVGELLIGMEVAFTDPLSNGVFNK